MNLSCITVKISSLKVLEEKEKIAFRALVDASISFRLAWIACISGKPGGRARESNKCPIAPEATTEATFSSLPM
jgi:hypothetical protein